MPFEVIYEDAPGEQPEPPAPAVQPLLEGLHYGWQAFTLNETDPQTFATRGEAIARLYRLLDAAEVGELVCIRRVIDGERS